MKSCPKEKRAEFWKYSYARESFVQSRELCNRVLSEPDMDQLSKISLTISIATSYGRPFKQHSPFRLDKRLVPDEFSEVHKNTITIRDKCVAHKDVDAPNTVFLVYSKNQVIVQNTEPVIKNEQAELLIQLTTKLIEKAEYHMGKFTRDYIHKSNLKDGRYLFDLDESDTSWLQKKS